MAVGLMAFVSWLVEHADDKLLVDLFNEYKDSDGILHINYAGAESYGGSIDDNQDSFANSFKIAKAMAESNYDIQALNSFREKYLD